MSFNSILDRVLNETIQSGLLTGSPFTPRGPEVNDSDQLVAYRLFYQGGPPAQYIWVVNYKGQAIARITRLDSKWVHNNWEYKVEEDQTIITPQDRAWYTELIQQLILRIKRAITARQADVVTLRPADFENIRADLPNAPEPEPEPTQNQPEDPAIAALPTLQDRIKARIAARQKGAQ